MSKADEQQPTAEVPALLGDGSKSDGASDKSAGPEHDEARVLSTDATDRVPTSVGVKRMEAIARAGDKRPVLMWTVRILILILGWTYTLQSSTTYNYEPLATSSFQQHSSGLAALSIASSLIGTVCKPFLAKISDLTGRPNTFVLSLSLYTMGFIIVAASSTLSAYVVGDVFIAIGFSGLQLLAGVIIADLTQLQWRGFAQGMIASPYIINCWIAGYIVDALADGEGWRWGYGMFAIIAPVVLTPAIATLIYLEHRAVKTKEATSSDAEKVDADAFDVTTMNPYHNAPWSVKIKNALIEIDAFGLLLLGFGWSLLLLPFALQPYAENSYANRSLIAMFCVGGACLIAYVVFEWKWSPFPSAPKRLLLNKTFLLSIVIDFVYLLAGQMHLLYFSSFVFIVKDWSVKNWTYFNNTLTMALCVFGVVAGVILRATHRYKALQIFGLAIKIIGMGLLVKRSGPTSTGRLVMSQVLVGAGGAFSVIGTQVASQASVPHNDVAAVISLLSLWSNIGGSIGSAIAVSVWGNMMPKRLRAHLPASVSDEQVATFYGSITSIRAYPYESEIRQGAIAAYMDTVWHLWPAALGIAFIPLICACFQTNYFLGAQQNAFDNLTLDGSKLTSEEAERIRQAQAQAQERPVWQFWRR